VFLTLPNACRYLASALRFSHKSPQGIAWWLFMLFQKEKAALKGREIESHTHSDYNKE
jgi:hypothetical protein